MTGTAWASQPIARVVGTGSPSLALGVQHVGHNTTVFPRA
jgi:hypothetical protein